jgi:hypothetical protein
LSESGTTPPAPVTNSAIAYRVALAAVIFLGVLIVIALGTVIVGLVTRFGGHRGAPAAFAQFTLAPGNRLLSTDVSGDRLVLRLRGPSGDEIDIIDIETGRLVAKIHSAAPPQK